MSFFKREETSGTPFCHNDIPPMGEYLEQNPNLEVFESGQPCGLPKKAHAHDIDKPNGIWWYCPRCDGPCSGCYTYTHPEKGTEA